MPPLNVPYGVLLGRAEPSRLRQDRQSTRNDCIKSKPDLFSKQIILIFGYALDDFQSHKGLPGIPSSSLRSQGTLLRRLNSRYYFDSSYNAFEGKSI